MIDRDMGHKEFEGCNETCESRGNAPVNEMRGKVDLIFQAAESNKETEAADRKIMDARGVENEGSNTKSDRVEPTNKRQRVNEAIMTPNGEKIVNNNSFD